MLLRLFFDDWGDIILADHTMSFHPHKCELKYELMNNYNIKIFNMRVFKKQIRTIHQDRILLFHLENMLYDTHKNRYNVWISDPCII